VKGRRAPQTNEIIGFCCTGEVGLGAAVSHTRKFTEILARATTLLGAQTAAEQWLEQPAIGLDQRRPIDLMTTPAGPELVEDYLGRIEYGVYT
jgi:putative toxin-antitoxin system antitoxin component (TIGR02293 family)